MSQSTFEVPDTDLYVSLTSGGSFKYYEGDIIPLLLAVDLQMPGAALPEDTTVPVPDSVADWVEETIDTAITDAAGGYTTENRTATAAGLTTGQITLGTEWVNVTSGNADHIIVLPDAPVGTIIRLMNGGTGYELRTHAPATVGINGGAEADAESAIGANVYVEVCRVSATNWVGTNRAAAGTVTATQVAAA